MSVVTKYAKKILEIISSSRSHMTAEQVFEALRQSCPKVALATVYNNLNRLWEEDLIRKISVEGMPDRYDRIQRHDHLVCMHCGRIEDIQLEDLSERLYSRLGKSFLFYDLKIYDLCPACRAAQQTEGGKYIKEEM